MTLSSLNQQIAALESTWNGLDQEPYARWRHLMRQRDQLTKEMFGCCGRPEWIFVECASVGAGAAPPRIAAHCPMDGRPCSRALSRELVRLFSILNKERSQCLVL